MEISMCGCSFSTRQVRQEKLHCIDYKENQDKHQRKMLSAVCNVYNVPVKKVFSELHVGPRWNSLTKLLVGGSENNTDMKYAAQPARLEREGGMSLNDLQNSQ
jgi:hypothetical protein